MRARCSWTELQEVFSNVAKLREAGLDVPQVTELFYDLTNEGIVLPSDILSEEEGAEILSAMLKK